MLKNTRSLKLKQLLNLEESFQKKPNVRVGANEKSVGIIVHRPGFLFYPENNNSRDNKIMKDLLNPLYLQNNIGTRPTILFALIGGFYYFAVLTHSLPLFATIIHLLFPIGGVESLIYEFPLRTGGTWGEGLTSGKNTHKLGSHSLWLLPRTLRSFSSGSFDFLVFLQMEQKVQRSIFISHGFACNSSFPFCRIIHIQIQTRADFYKHNNTLTDIQRNYCSPRHV